MPEEAGESENYLGVSPTWSDDAPVSSQQRGLRALCEKQSHNTAVYMYRTRLSTQPWHRLIMSLKPE